MLKRLSWLLVLVVITGCSTTKPTPTNNDVVIWLSLDGMRGDYVDRDRGRLPTLSRLMRDGAFTRELVPVFPSITFPSHTSQATGVAVSEHGVTGNTFYDSRTKQLYKYPDDAALIEAEPIWVTAARQHVRSAVINWPMSNRQQGAARADYSEDAFDKEATDADRLARLLQVWRDDDPSQHGGRPLRLLMSYVLAPDKIGHKHGPDSPELRQALVEMDQLLGEFLAEAQRLFARDHTDPRDRLWIIFTTDHGMTPSKGTLKLDDVLGRGTEKDLHAAMTGPVANLFLDDVPWYVRGTVADALVKRLREHPNIKAWKRDDLPKHWHFAHPTRTGNIVAMLDVGWSWKSSEPMTTTTQSTRPATTQTTGPRGQHGYAAEDDPNMLGFAVFCSPGHAINERDLRRVDSLQLHPTVARLLGIQPAKRASGRALAIDAGPIK
ncbi:MAG: alkaline phosphatase family protein [Anaerolineae bacterium]|nr:alkaline phosphatase family protein [Phycisphaerae bacterium]